MPTVTVETPPFSAILAGSAVNTNTGGSSSSVIVTVCGNPKPVPARKASITTVSSSSSILSSRAVSVVVTVEAVRPTPAGSVSVESTK